jgi:hypothetical protein
MRFLALTLVGLASCGGNEIGVSDGGTSGVGNDVAPSDACPASAGNGYVPAASFDDACPLVGGLGQPCYPDGTCDYGLTCADVTTPTRPARQCTSS